MQEGRVQVQGQDRAVTSAGHIIGRWSCGAAAYVRGALVARIDDCGAAEPASRCREDCTPAGEQTGFVIMWIMEKHVACIRSKLDRGARAR